MINIRYGLFETNSSSVHSMTLLTQDEYEKWESGNYYIDLYEGKILTNGFEQKTSVRCADEELADWEEIEVKTH